MDSKSIPSTLVTEHLKDVSQGRLRRTLFVGGLDEEAVTQDLLRQSFEVFGQLRHVEIPFNKHTNKNRGFGFIEYEEERDAKSAIENMNGAELLGRTLVVNLARRVDHEATFDPEPHEGYILGLIQQMRST